MRVRGIALLAPLLFACTDAARAPKDVVASVNGKPITATEIELRQAGKATAETQAEARDALVLLELQAQRAVELGLDADEGFQAAQQRAEAQLREARRRELAKLFRTKEVLDKIVVSDDDARRYFEANRARVQTQLTVHQILVNGRAAATAAAAELAAGKPFEEVAAALLPIQIPAATPEAAVTRIQAVARSLKFEERRDQLDKQLRARAAIQLSSL